MRKVIPLFGLLFLLSACGLQHKEVMPSVGGQSRAPSVAKASPVKTASAGPSFNAPGADDSDVINTLTDVDPTSGSFGGSNYPSQLYDFLIKEDANRQLEQGYINCVATKEAPTPTDIPNACLGTTGAGLTMTPSLCVAYNAFYRSLETGSITFPDNKTCWVAIDENTSGNNAGIPTFTRVGTTHYLTDCTSSTAPAMAADSQLLMQVVTSGGAITTVNDYRNKCTGNQQIGGVLATSLGCVDDGVTNNATNGCQTRVQDLVCGRNGPQLPVHFSRVTQGIYLFAQTGSGNIDLHNCKGMKITCDSASPDPPVRLRLTTTNTSTGVGIDIISNQSGIIDGCFIQNGTSTADANVVTMLGGAQTNENQYANQHERFSNDEFYSYGKGNIICSSSGPWLFDNTILGDIGHTTYGQIWAGNAANLPADVVAPNGETLNSFACTSLTFLAGAAITGGVSDPIMLFDHEASGGPFRFIDTYFQNVVDGVTDFVDDAANPYADDLELIGTYTENLGSPCTDNRLSNMNGSARHWIVQGGSWNNLCAAANTVDLMDFQSTVPNMTFASYAMPYSINGALKEINACDACYGTTIQTDVYKSEINCPGAAMVKDNVSDVITNGNTLFVNGYNASTPAMEVTGATGELQDMINIRAGTAQVPSANLMTFFGTNPSAGAVAYVNIAGFIGKHGDAFIPYSTGAGFPPPAAPTVPNNIVEVYDAPSCSAGDLYGAGGGSVKCYEYSDGTYWKAILAVP